MKLPLSIVIALSLAACSDTDTATTSDQTEPNEREITSNVNNTEAAKAKSPDAPASESPAENRTSPATQFTSHYTDIKKVKCETVELDEEGPSYIREKCGTFKGVPLHRVEGDLRQSAFAGNQPSGQSTIGPFNFLGDIVEWRMQAGEPIALIYRLRADSPDLPGHGKTQLFVQKIGVGTNKSCMIGMVAGQYPSANEKAREIADTAPNVACNNSLTPKTFGELL